MLSITDLANIATKCRDDAIVMAEACGSGHLGGSFSIMDVLVALNFRIMKKGDVLVYSKAHCCEALYAVMCEGVSADELKSFGDWGSRLQCHSERWALKWVDFSGGSLGQGLSYACGVALGKKLKGESGRVYCIVGDGELQEGQNWEAVMFAYQYSLNNLVLIVDNNQHTGDSDNIRNVMDVRPLGLKFQEFNWAWDKTDGNDMKSVVVVLERANMLPVALIMETVKGSGVKLWEESHSHLQFGKELEEGIKEWRKNGLTSGI
jgi:transketolase